ncbi:MAG: rRNA maturation RNase YbeY [Microcystaceae cyanobacterium]
MTVLTVPTVDLYLQSPSSLPSTLAADALPDETQWQQWFTLWLAQLGADLPPASAYELTLRLTNDQEIQHLNAQFRHQDRPTDVLSFASLEDEVPSVETDSLEPLYLGDLVISLETAARQALEVSVSLTTELAWLAAHGLLHLLGWDHPDDLHLQEMIRRQADLLQHIGLDYCWQDYF